MVAPPVLEDGVLFTSALGRAVQVDPIKLKLKAPGSMLLKLNMLWTAIRLCFQF